MNSELAYDITKVANEISNWTSDALRGITPIDTREEGDVRRMLSYLHSDAQHFSREEMRGHFTASVMVTQGDKALLLFHKKLSIWVQPGGHIEAGEFPYLAAVREMEEELGISAKNLIDQPRLIMADIHTFPARETSPAHDHLDLRFHGVLKPGATLKLNIDEATSCKWFSFEELLQSDATNRGVRRTIQKVVLQRDFAR